MGASERARQLWPRAERFLCDYVALAEIFLLDWHVRELPSILKVLMKSMHSSHISILDSYALEEQLPFNAEMERAILDSVASPPSELPESSLLDDYVWNSIVGPFFQEEHLQVLLIVDRNTAMFDIELVFSCVSSFPQGQGEAKHLWMLENYLALVDQLRGDKDAHVCLLTSECNGDPRELLGGEDMVLL